MTDFELSVYNAVKKVPRGFVTTYGDIARYLGNRGLARAVGNALHKNPYEGIVPCHRVVKGDGSLAPSFVFGGITRQKELLEFEEVEVINFKVDLEVFRYIF